MRTSDINDLPVRPLPVWVECWQFFTEFTLVQFLTLFLMQRKRNNNRFTHIHILTYTHSHTNLDTNTNNMHKHTLPCTLPWKDKWNNNGSWHCPSIYLSTEGREPANWSILSLPILKNNLLFTESLTMNYEQTFTSWKSARKQWTVGGISYWPIKHQKQTNNWKQ